MKKGFLLFCCLFLLLPPAGLAAFTPLHRGVNLGNMLEAPAEGAWGEAFQDEYATIIVSAGFDHVRLPVQWSIYAAEEAPYPIWHDIFDRVDHILSVLTDAGLSVILDLHHFDALWENPKAETPKFLSLWRQIAEHYQSAPDSVLFELANEPQTDPATWNALVRQGIDVIRQTNPTRNILIQGTGWGSGSELFDLDLPQGDPHLIGTFHLYDPFAFTHQGIDFIDGAAAWLGTQWQETTADTADIRRSIALAKAWSQETGLPVHLGEFGVYEKADAASTNRWIAYVARLAEKSGISWSYWEFCSVFGLYDDDARAFHPGMLEALMEQP